MAGRTHSVTLRVRFGETDAAGIVYYPTFFAWFDVATHALLRAAVGELRGPDMRPRHPIPIVDAGARFAAPLYYDDLIEIRSTVGHVGTSSMRIDHVVLRRGEEVARGFEARVVIAHEGERIKPVPMPEGWRSALSESVTTFETAYP